MIAVNRRAFLRSMVVTGATGLALTLPAGLPGSGAYARQPEIYTGLLSSTGAGGYDVVAYHTQGRPVKGSSKYKTKWKGASWRFSSAKNRDLFVANPARYAPRYGGYCAWAIAQGSTAKGDPRHWKIVDNRLYLNYNADIQRRWEGNIPGFIRSGDRNWPGIIGR